MSEENFAPYYSKIAKVLDKMIPVEWTEMMLIFFEDEGVLSRGIYYRAKDGVLYWAENIPMDLHVDEEIYDSIGEELYEVCKSYKKEFIKETRDEWSYMLFHLTAGMEFDIKYYYDTDSSVDVHDMMDRIFYESYQIEPKGDFSKKRLYRYLAEKKSNK